MENNPYSHLKKPLSVQTPEGSIVNGEYFDIVNGFGDEYQKLPFSIRILLESAVRCCDNKLVKEIDVTRISNWWATKDQDVEIQFKPARVVLQDFTGVPAVVDLAAMRDAVAKIGGDPKRVNPVCPTDLVIDHSVQVDYFGGPTSLEKNQELEFERNHERFAFLKWGASAFKNMLIVPPGNGIVHQVNLEYLARVVFTKPEGSSTSDDDDDNNSGAAAAATVFYPDSVVGTDSHTTMINGLGVLGWGVGGIEAEAVMLGLAMSMVLPQVIGYKLTGTLNQNVTSTDVVLTITKNLRSIGVVGKFIEFFGPGVGELSIADRATISNMCPENKAPTIVAGGEDEDDAESEPEVQRIEESDSDNEISGWTGATCSFFPVDKVTINYLRQSNRNERDIAVIEAYLKANGLFVNEQKEDNGIQYSQIVTLDLSTVVTCLSGPKRPHDKVNLDDMKQDFLSCLKNKIGFKGYGIPENKLTSTTPFTYEGQNFELRHGSVLIAAITSCTNTSNPSVMLGAGLLARKAVSLGLKVPKYVKTSLSPGSGVVTYYLNESGVINDLKTLGFDIVGYGCMTCIGNSGPLPAEVEKAVESSDLVCCGVLSGNRNFEGRIHPLLRANYLASPLLVIAYALAGRVDIDFETEPIQGNVFLNQIWPTRNEIRGVEEEFVIPSMFKKVYGGIAGGNPRWNDLKVDEKGVSYDWDEASSYIRKPPFVEEKGEVMGEKGLKGAACLLLLGDSVTTDHISPAGSISRTSPAARYLGNMGLNPNEFNSYGSRRGNDQVMARGTFANIRLVNRLNKDERTGKVVPGPRTLYIPGNEIMDIYDAAQRYGVECPDTPLLVIAGKDYGSGSSRDWAAKGPKLLGIKVIIAESYERIHRSNLVGMGVLPLQFKEGQTIQGLTGTEKFDLIVVGGKGLKAKGIVGVKTNTGVEFETIVRIDTDVELEYYRSGGILPFLVGRMV